MFDLAKEQLPRKVAALLYLFRGLEGQKLIIIGNSLQAIANAAQADLTLEQERARSNNLNVLGNLL